VELTQRIEIISAYGAVLQNRRLTVGRESDLPSPKEIIRNALAEELVNPADLEMVNALEVSFIELESFLSDEEFEVVSQFERAIAEGKRLMEEGDPKRAAALISGVPKEAMEIQRKINQQQEERLRQIQNIRQLRRTG